MPSDIAIETDALTKTFVSRFRRREVQAVKGISLSVPRGTTYGLLGPNGAGKTTFVKMLLSATHPTSGTARIFGFDNRIPSARREIGYLPENHRFPTYFTGEGMLDFYGALSGVDPRTRRRLIPELFDRVGLERQWMDVRIGKYSKGMLQRVGLAQAMIHSPKLLILDEPSDGVDPVGRRLIRDVLNHLERQGVTIFINSHLLVEVEQFCRQVAIINKGKVALEGDVATLTAGKGYRLKTPNAMTDVLRTAVSARASRAAVENGSVDFFLPTIEAANEVIDLLRGEKHPVEALVPTTSTLEDVFIKTVNG